MNLPVRRLRRVMRAHTGHGYNVQSYSEYADGSYKDLGITSIPIDKTGIRLRDKNASVWEEKIPNMMAGWSRCDAPIWYLKKD